MSPVGTSHGPDTGGAHQGVEETFVEAGARGEGGGGGGAGAGGRAPESGAARDGMH